MTGETPGQADWWAELYDDLLADMYLEPHDPAELDATVAFLVRALELSPGRLVFDQCCGVGAVSLALAEAGMRTIGVDLPGSYIRRARAGADARGLPCRFERADAFDYVPPEPCAAALNWRTSFGYAPDDRRNAAMLRRVFEALEPGGRFVLDYQNVPRVLRDFQACMVRRHPTDEGEVVLLRESTLDLPRGTLDQRWTFLRPDGRRLVRGSSVRLYLPDALGALLRGVGFEEVAFRGDLGGEPLGLDSPRCLALARRPLR